ncbi:MAG: NAD(P)-binding domain-containing protein [Flavobacteriales bacterium]|nr:NAD(P)-binding domain-containing protein [Flavobacteriales bacterium]
MILLYGTGRAATHLGHAFVKAGVQVVGVVGRNEEARNALAKVLGTKAYSKRDELPKADVIFVGDARMTPLKKLR